MEFTMLFFITLIGFLIIGFCFLVRQKLKNELNKLKKNLNETQRITHIGSWELDFSSQQLIWSDMIFQIFEINSKQVKPSYEGFLEIIHPEDREQVDQSYKDSLIQKTRYDITHRLMMSDGRIKYVHERAEHLFDDKGNPIRSIGTVQDITESKLVEEKLKITIDALKQSDQHLQETLDLNQKLIAASYLGIVAYNASGECILANDSMTKILNATRQEILNQNFKEIASWKTFGLLKMAEDCLEQMQAQQGECHIISSSGKELWLACYFSPFITSGELHLLLMVNDISERKKTEHQLKNISERLLLATKAAQIGIWDWNLQGNTVEWDEQMYLLYGIEPFSQPITIDVFNNRLHPDDVQKNNEHSKAAFRGEKEYNTELRILWDDGSIKYLKAFAMIQRDTDGNPLRMLGTNWDITELRTSAKALEQSEERYRLLFENAAEAIYILSADGNSAGSIVQANKAAAIMHGYTVEELERMHITDLDIPETAVDAENKITRILAGEWVKGETLHVRKDKAEFPIEYAAGLLEIHGKKYILAFSNDISERKKAEEAMLAAKENAEIASRAKSEFLANISHEIRTPMNAIIGLGHLLLQTELSPKQRDYMDKIQFSAKSLLGIINDVLDFSKIEAGKLELNTVHFYLETLFDGIASLFTAKVEEKKIKLLFSIDTLIPRSLMGDYLRISQLFTNLVGNAVKFTEHGEIIVSAQLMRLEKDFIVIQFSVKDTGIGIKEEQLQFLFTPFTQADSSTTRKFGGTGLGLSICKKLIEMMHGEIRVQSEYGKGSEFRFTIMLGCKSECAYPEFNFLEHIYNNNVNSYRHHEHTVMKTKGLELIKGSHILVVEDHPLNQQVALEMLQQAGFIVSIAQHGKDALNYLKKQDMVFDLILMDVQMPEMDGFEATRHIREMISKDIPIIAMTAHALVEERQKCLDASMNDHIAKPIEVEELHRVLVKWIKPKPFQKTDLKPVNPKKETSPDDHSLPEFLQSIDIPSGLKRLGNNKSLFKKLLIQFKNDNADMFSSIKSSIEKLDYQQAQYLIHGLKGMSGSIAATELNHLLKALETSVIRQDTYAISDYLYKSEQEWENVIRSIERLEKEYKETKVEHQENILDKTDLSHQLVELHNLLKVNNFKAISIFGQLKGTLMETISTKENVTNLENALNGLKFKEARMYLQSIASDLSIVLE
ncbi:MAG: PAS domain S-box protein [Desulfobacterales bacterium]|nr:PAS domain S-box protein [Desulfobacterales bacterium]